VQAKHDLEGEDAAPERRTLHHVASQNTQDEDLAEDEKPVHRAAITGERGVRDRPRPQRGIEVVCVLHHFLLLVSANDCIEPLAANQPIYTAGRYRESAPMLG
jgi:hypothetical protein